jgi:hypothetical protein
MTLVAVLALPAGTALARQGTGKGERGPAPRACVELRAKMGVANFRAAFGSNVNRHNAFGKCVRDQRRVNQQMRKLAVEQCRQEAHDDLGQQEGNAGDDDSDSGDETGEDPGDELDAEGGATGSVAECVDHKLKRLAQAQNERFAKAARTCKRQLASHRKGRIARRGNAFARCVRAHVRSGAEDRDDRGSEPGDDGADDGDDAGGEPGDDDEAVEEPGDDAEE